MKGKTNLKAKKMISVLSAVVLLAAIPTGCGERASSGGGSKSAGNSSSAKKDASSSSENYEKIINNFIDAVNNCDGAKLLEAMGSKSFIDTAEVEEGEAEFDEALAFYKEDFEAYLGSDVEFSAEIVHDNKVQGYKLDYIKEEWSDYYKEKIEGAIMVECNITLRGSNDSTSRRVMFYLVELEDSGYALIDEMRYTDGGDEWQEVENDGLWCLLDGSIFDFEAMDNYELSKNWLTDGTYTWQENDMYYDGNPYGDTYGEMIIDHSDDFVFNAQYYYPDGTEVRLPTDYGTSGSLVQFYGNDIMIQENGDIIFCPFGGITPGGGHVEDCDDEYMRWYFYGEGDYRLEDGSSVTKS